ncbi:MAG: cell division protein FtsA, partial [Hyphomonadaceae bacterium]
PAPHRVEKSRAVLAAALDVGCAKTVCLATPMSCTAPGQRGRPLDVIGAGIQATSAASGAADFESCARSIRIAIDEAERGAEESIREVVACYSGPGLHARIVRGQARVRGTEIGVREAQAALAAAIHAAPAPGKAALHVAPLGYSIDGGALVSDPRGRQGSTLTVEACIVTAPGQAVDALRQCIRAAGVEPADIVAAPYAAALGAATDEERAQGVLVIDLGAGGAGVAVLCAEGLVHVDHVPIGGARMTRDLAKALGATFPAAERAKLLHGVVGGAYDPREALEAPRVGDDGRLEAQIIAKKTIHDALAPRFRETILLARARVAEARLGANRAPQRAILTGGGAQIAGAREVAQELLGLPVRIGRPMGVNDIDAGQAGAAFTTAAGLLRWRLDRPPEAAEAQAYEPSLREVSRAATAAASRAWAWLKDNF